MASSLYQLPCTSCDQPIQVSLTQAGEELQCSCGAEVLVPTMREVKALPAVDVPERPDASPKSSWSPGQGALFAIGILLLASGFYMHVLLTSAREKIDINRPEFVENDDIKDLDPFSAWQMWEAVNKMTRDSGELPYRRTPEFIARRNEYSRLTRNRMASWAVIAVGAVTTCAAFAARMLGRKR
ncbi:hypothetical protein ACFL2H_12740 [Planctomycetota bacterium]